MTNDKLDPNEVLNEIEEAVGCGLEPIDSSSEKMDIYERWERSAPERQG